MLHNPEGKRGNIVKVAEKVKTQAHSYRHVPCAVVIKKHLKLVFLIVKSGFKDAGKEENFLKRLFLGTYSQDFFF